MLRLGIRSLPASKTERSSWRRLLLPGLILGLLLTIVPIQAAVWSDHNPEGKILATVTPVKANGDPFNDPLIAPEMVVVGIPFPVTAEIVSNSSDTIFDIVATLQLPVGFSVANSLRQELGDLPPFGEVSATWQLVAESVPLEEFVLLVVITTGTPGGTGQQFTVEDTAIIQVVDATSDYDGDGISNQLDLLPFIVSNAFGDSVLGGTSTGIIVANAWQTLSVAEEPNPEGVRLKTAGRGIETGLGHALRGSGRDILAGGRRVNSNLRQRYYPNALRDRGRNIRRR